MNDSYVGQKLSEIRQDGDRMLVEVTGEGLAHVTVGEYAIATGRRARTSVNSSNCRLLPTLDHRLGPGDVSFEAKRFRHVAVAIPQVRISRVIAMSPR
jgi:hypothetical protein